MCGTSLQVMHLDAEKEMMSQCVALLGKFIAVREPNIRYLGLVSACLSNGSFTLFMPYAGNLALTSSCASGNYHSVVVSCNHIMFIFAGKHG
jgi:hypothetical protein